MKRLIGILCLLSVFAGCGKGGDNDNFTGGDSGDCVGGGWCGNEEISVTADLSSAKALFTLEDSSSSVLSSENVAKTPKALISNQSKFYKLMENGTYEEVITAASSSNSDAKGDLPPISYIASNDQGDVFVAFQHPFMYRKPPSDFSDPWSASSPYTCQLFRVNATISESTGEDSLACITNSLELDTWDYRTNKIQFDSSGNAYFTAHVPQNWKNVLIKWNRSSTAEADSNGVLTYPTSSLSEIINANIVFRDYLVVPTGGVFYTGFTSTSGDYNDSGSFLRFRANSGALQEITSGWWDYIFQPVGVDDTLLGIDASISLATSVSERVIFYGPDPLIATSPEWNDSCLFLYNPNESGSARSTQVADCDIDVWNYVNSASTLATEKSRCEETKYLLGGGNQPKKILISDSYDSSGNYIQDGSYTAADEKKEIFIVGNAYYKQAGTWLYDICVDEGAHCVDSSGVPDYTNRNDQTACENASGTWSDGNDCYNQLSSSTLYTSLTTGAASSDANWRINGQWCQAPGGDWRQTYSGLAKVNYTNSTTKSITLLSSTDEIVKNGWAVSNRLYYVAFNSTDGKYYLKEVGDSTAILTGYEVYEIFKHPTDSTKLYFNGLRFSDNSYVMGSFNPDEGESSLSVETGITGQIETLVVIPDSALQ